MDHKHKCQTSNYKNCRRLTGENPHKFRVGLGTDFLHEIQKTPTMKGETNILAFCSSNNSIKKKKRLYTLGENIYNMCI